MTTLLDFQQVIKNVYSEATNRLRVDIGANITLDGQLEVSIDAADGDSILVVGTEDGSVSGTQHVLRIDNNLNARVKDPGLPAALGQEIADDSTSVVLATDQPPIYVQQFGTWDIQDITGTITLPTGAATEATLQNIYDKPVQIFTLPYDSITVSYPSSTQEIYESRIGGISGTIQQTVTVNYTDATKNYIQDVART